MFPASAQAREVFGEHTSQERRGRASFRHSIQENSSQVIQKLSEKKHFETCNFLLTSSNGWQLLQNRLNRLAEFQKGFRDTDRKLVVDDVALLGLKPLSDKVRVGFTT